MAASMYGAVLGVSIAFLTSVLPEPLGWTLVWGLIALELAVGAIVVWRRTGLQGTTCSFLWTSGAALVCAVASSRGLKFMDLLRDEPVLVIAFIAIPPLLMFPDRWRHPAEWAQFKRRSDEASLMDIFAFRHIPDLRKR